jgi:hypothetical protein
VIYHILHVCENTDNVEQELPTIFALNVDHGVSTVVPLDLDVWHVLRISGTIHPLVPLVIMHQLVEPSFYVGTFGSIFYLASCGFFVTVSLHNPGQLLFYEI